MYLYVYVSQYWFFRPETEVLPKMHRTMRYMRYYDIKWIFIFMWAVDTRLHTLSEFITHTSPGEALIRVYWHTYSEYKFFQYKHWPHTHTHTLLTQPVHLMRGHNVFLLTKKLPFHFLIKINRFTDSYLNRIEEMPPRVRVDPSQYVNKAVSICSCECEWNQKRVNHTIKVNRYNRRVAVS